MGIKLFSHGNKGRNGNLKIKEEDSLERRGSFVQTDNPFLFHFPA